MRIALLEVTGNCTNDPTTTVTYRWKAESLERVW
jgi:hypothetical protein